MLEKSKFELKSVEHPVRDRMINERIVDIFDTMKITNMLFHLIANNDDSDNPFADPLFVSCMNFTNKLIATRPHSLQKKFFSFFKSHEERIGFFLKTRQYLEVYYRKLENGLLRKFYETHKHPE